MKNVLSEMIASMNYQEEMNALDVDDSLEEQNNLDEEIVRNRSLSPESDDDITLIEPENRGKRPTDFTLRKEIYLHSYIV